MKATKLFTTIAAMAALLSAGFASQVEAAEVNSDSSSSATVTLTGGATDESHPPVAPGEDGDGTTTGNTGQLTLDYVPNFKFGTHAVSDNLTALKNTVSNSNAQVTDYRATGAGWKLQVALGEFKDGTDQTKKLSGVTLSLNGATKKIDDTNLSAAPTVSSVSLSSNGQPADLVDAATDAGMGQWLINFFNETGSTATLNIPQGNKAGEYSAQLIWRLTDAV